MEFELKIVHRAVILHQAAGADALSRLLSTHGYVEAINDHRSSAKFKILMNHVWSSLTETHTLNWREDDLLRFYPSLQRTKR